MADLSDEESGLPLFDEVIAALKKHQVEFMIIGGFAVIYHGHVRATEDLDIFIRRSDENARKVVTALKEVSQGELDLSADVFTDGKGVLIGDRPLRVDILAEIAGVTFDEAWAHRRTDLFGPAEVHFISREDLIANKRAAGRPQDLDDARELSAGGDASGA